MEFFYTVIALLTAGIAFSTGIIHLFIGLHREGEKIDLVFATMALSLFVFFLLPPVGFIFGVPAPYPMHILIKRIFNNSFLAFFPWFIFYYAGYRKILIPVLIDIASVIFYIVMASTKTNGVNPPWIPIMLVTLGANAVYGASAGLGLLKKGEKQKGRWLLSAMAFFVLFYLATIVNQLENNYFGKLLGTQLFFPVNLIPLSFMVIMSVRLAANIFDKYRLEKMLRLRDARWDQFLHHTELLVLELDRKGKIKYVNPNAVNELGYSSEAELLGKNGVKMLAAKGDPDLHQSFFNNAIETGDLPTKVIARVVTKDKRILTISWTNVLIYDSESRVEGSISLGLNITNQQDSKAMVLMLQNELEKRTLVSEEDYFLPENPSGIIGKSDAIVMALERAQRVADSNATVLLDGETGVGKELFADLIQERGPRAAKAFIKTNCAGFPADLIESELFGHEKGAFTGAIQSRKGRFELADGGTIFLDEIAELPMPLQAKLLRVLQNGKFERVGGQETIKVDVRVISASNKNLLHEVKSGRFREDLYYRLNVFPITIPPLRERKDDIELLVKHYLLLFSNKHNRKIDQVSNADLMRLADYSWPGNIRELVNLIERSVISSHGDTLKIEWPESGKINGHAAPILSLEDMERLHLKRVLKECNGKINGSGGAAEKLGLNPNTLRSRLKKLNITRDDSMAV